VPDFRSYVTPNYILRGITNHVFDILMTIPSLVISCVTMLVHKAKIKNKGLVS
jgi:ABC-type antimicrobial peptide transport system permease subunit